MTRKRKPNESPLCWGLYKDNMDCCQNCDSTQGCAEELAKSILEGTNTRPAAIMELGQQEKYCLTCGKPYTPLDDKDNTCKSCLRKLHLELIEKMGKDISELYTSIPRKLKAMSVTVDRYSRITKPGDSK